MSRLSSSESSSPAAGDDLFAPLQFLAGVGPQRAKLLERLGLCTALDLVFHFPRDYEDHTERRTVRELEEGLTVSVTGTVVDVDGRSSGFGRSMVGVLLEDATGAMRAVWFNQPFMREKFGPGQQVVFSGKPRWRGTRWEMVHPRVTWLDQDDAAPAEAILPIYNLTEGVTQGQMRYLVGRVVERCAPVVEEILPDALRQRLDVISIEQALRVIHAPATHDALAAARRRFVLQELLLLQLALAQRRWQRQEKQQAPPLQVDAKVDARIVRLLPFRLTAEQRRAVDEVAGDMAQPRPMNRLLQGDVGSGKTVVALYAMLLCIARGHQAVLMAPTEILAQQHFETTQGYLEAARVRCALLTGALTARQRADLSQQIAQGEIDLIVGTQAVVQSDVKFAKLGLVVIDEQHKFGVAQRASLRQAGVDPHYLVMTATPIPRTLSLAMFADLDVSTLAGAPPGRQPVKTFTINPSERDRWWEFVRKKLRQGRQAYVVTPLVEDSEQVIAVSVEAAFEDLANGPLEAFRLGLLHGRMSSAEKEAAMEAFRKGETQVLVATAVVEVGVDVPNATVMTIDGAERFGLAQLHQLRGRISRGVQPGFCGVFVGEVTKAARERLELFVSTNDGFELADADFQMRGPGELLGTRQHGLPPLRMADLARDAELVVEARRAAQELIDEDPLLQKTEHARLRQRVAARYGKALDLGDVG
ncbi:MAG: ATP-dependent DNA helicase RecG [Pirellulales bacterium]